MRNDFFRFPVFNRNKDTQAQRRAAWEEVFTIFDRALQMDSRARKLLLQYGDQLLQRRRASEQSLKQQEMDRAILRAFQREGGIAFYGWQLQGYTNHILPGEEDLHAMYVAGFSSAIEPMQRRLKDLEAKLAAMEAAAEATQVPLGEAELLQTLQYQDLTEQKQRLQSMLPGPKRTEDPAPARAAAEQLTIQARMNMVRALEVQRDCEFPLEETCTMQNLPLLERMRTLLSARTVQALCREEGWTPEDYRRALTRYSQQLTEDLLVPFGGTKDAS